ncbi:MAG: hypothetical protein IMW97_06830 [Firmicutes bacterium]|nr:hypothetical protein [Candidatus Fermentithermobacillaceae bacterium]
MKGKAAVAEPVGEKFVPRNRGDEDSAPVAVLGIAGTAKNTGKTTALNQVIRGLGEEGRNFAVTSIGFDGEDFDTVTGLAKPRVFLPEGSVVATAQPLLRVAGAEFCDVRDTGVTCALGRVVAGRVKKAGRVVLAGPSTTRGLGRVMQFLAEATGVELVLVDGAFSRMAPMCLASHLIVATGAARNEDVSALAAEVTGIGTVMSLPLLDSPVAGSCPRSGDFSGAAWSFGARAQEVPGGQVGRAVELGTALMTRSSVPGGLVLVRRVATEGALTAHASGPVNPFALEEFVEILGKDLPALRVKFILDHPVNLLVTGQASSWPRVVARLVEKGHEMAVLKTTALLGFTLNPFKPAFQESSGKYRAEQLDAAWFLSEVRSRTPFPVTDIILEGPSLLESWISSMMLEVERHRA